MKCYIKLIQGIFMQKQILASIIIPVYNAEKYITETVKNIEGK